MKKIENNSIDLIITSPPYFNIKDYSKDGKQEKSHSISNNDDVGNLEVYEEYIEKMLIVWKECYRVLKPNGKMCINVPLMPMLKKEMNLNHNRHLFDLQSDIQNSILKNTKFNLLDLYIWSRTNSTKKLMFGSYPMPGNFYAQNTSEFVAIYVKDGKPINDRSNKIKELSVLTKEEWLEFTKQIWSIPIPNKGDIAFGKHSAIMPEELVRRLVKLFSFVGDIVLDPFAGSGTTLKVAYENGRKYVGFELYSHYKEVINKKIEAAKKKIDPRYKEFVKNE
ncbi:DNA-methyltransferase [Spiroplasma endosymbiont of Cantharis lateralis]|uniref:DNA-methyltransferase n=1 Tax=Spiroplasma endosymbiont of Cantharis lateralis TaxID=3066277 RepID=UPI003CC7A6CA